jgi:hypothetical protein
MERERESICVMQVKAEKKSTIEETSAEKRPILGSSVAKKKAIEGIVLA